MAHKIEIIGKSLVITDTVLNKIIVDTPKVNTYYYLESLLNGEIEFFDVLAVQNIGRHGTAYYKGLLSNAIDSINAPFTENSFIDFCRQNLGFSTASGGSDAIKYTATNYNDLLTKSTASLQNGDLAYVEASQGISWLPGTLGGTYYAEGWYVWTGIAWVSDRTNISKELSTTQRLSVIDNLSVVKVLGYSNKTAWEVGDVFNGFVTANRYVSGIVVGLPFDVDDNSKVNLAIDNIL